VRFASLFLLCATLASCSREGAPSASQQAEIDKHVVTEAPSGMTKVDVDFDGKVRLVGYLVSPSDPLHKPGSKVTVIFVWRCEKKLEDGYALFTHLVAASGRQLDNLDDKGLLRHIDGVKGQPLPPSKWQPGKLYLDDITFTVPEDPGPTLVVAPGIYKGRERLPIRGRGGDRESRATVVRLATGEKDQRSVIKELSPKKLAKDETLVIDGKLDEPSWAGAASTGTFVDVGSGRESPHAPTRGVAKVLWDDTNLYVGFDVTDKKVHGGWPAGAKDPHLWEKDTVEIMIDPDGDGDNKDYYEIQVSPQNLVFDTQYDAYNSPNGNGRGPFGHEEWSAGLTSAVIVHGTMDDDSDSDQGYTVEAKIPWASFTKARRSPPQPGDVWRMNFYAMKNNGGTAWSPILGMGNFHRASRFGRVRWSL
jgi:hypothetical protein